MKFKDVKKLPLGVYRINWKSGGTSVATIGATANGGRWLAPSNWVSPSDEKDIWRWIESAILISE